MDRCQELTRCFKSKVRIFGLNLSVITEGLDTAREINEVACLAEWNADERLRCLQDALSIVERTCQNVDPIRATADRSSALLACLHNNVACLQAGRGDKELAHTDRLFDCEGAPLATRTVLLLNRASFILQWLCLDPSARSQAFAVGTAFEHANAAMRVLESLRPKADGTGAKKKPQARADKRHRRRRRYMIGNLRVDLLLACAYHYAAFCMHLKLWQNPRSEEYTWRECLELYRKSVEIMVSIGPPHSERLRVMTTNVKVAMTSVETRARRNHGAGGALALDELLLYCKGFPHVSLSQQQQPTRQKRPSLGSMLNASTHPQPPRLAKGPRERPTLSNDRRLGLFDHGKRLPGGRFSSCPSEADSTTGLHFVLLPLPTVEGAFAGLGSEIVKQAPSPSADASASSPPLPPTPATGQPTKVRRRVYHHVEIVSEMEIACTAVQKLVRSRISRKAYQNTKSAIIKLQALARLKTKRQRFLQQRKAAIRVQTEQRRRVGRKEANARRRVLQAVLAIQRWSIGCLARLQRRTLLATILIQRWTRVCLSALELRRLAAADVIQRWSRNRISWLRLQRRLRYLLRRAAREALARKEKAATRIQSRFRCITCKVAYARVMKERARERAAILAQTLFRRHGMRGRFVCFRIAIIKLQSACRRRAAVRVVRKTRQRFKAATVLQCLARKSRARRRLQGVRVRALTTRAAITLQCALRIRLAHRQRDERIVLRSELRCSAATRAQTCWRLYRARQLFCIARTSVILVQNQIRILQAKGRVKDRRSYFVAAGVLQCAWRGAVARAKFARLKTRRRRTKAASVVQRAVRAHLVRLGTLEGAAAIKIQAIARMVQSKSRVARRRKGVYLSLLGFGNGYHGIVPYPTHEANLFASELDSILSRALEAVKRAEGVANSVD